MEKYALVDINITYTLLDCFTLHAVTSYDPDSHFTMSALSQLEGVGIPVITSLNTNVYRFQQVLSVFVPYLSAFYNASSLLNAWLSSGVLSRLPPTWKSLLLIIHLLNLDELAQKMEIYLSGSIEEQHSKIGAIESEGE